MREVDRQTYKALGISEYALMCRAGEAGFRALTSQWPDARRIIVFCGTGNNGGDGWVLVRLAQEFSLRYPLIEGHGNFGSRDGDGAAAMRYTEARLTTFSELLLSEVDEGTVNFNSNYDGSFVEPMRLPARLPICLLNGASGIAVGMATEIPPHNLREVSNAILSILQDSNLNEEQIFNIVKGPDFPGGGQVISSFSQIKEIYLSGKGTIRTQARWKFEDLARGQWRMIVYELPHGISSKKNIRGNR